MHEVQKYTAPRVDLSSLWKRFREKNNSSGNYILPGREIEMKKAIKRRGQVGTFWTNANWIQNPLRSFFPTSFICILQPSWQTNAIFSPFRVLYQSFANTSRTLSHGELVKSKLSVVHVSKSNKPTKLAGKRTIHERWTQESRAFNSESNLKRLESFPRRPK